jgi:hypothetical protein
LHHLFSLSTERPVKNEPIQSSPSSAGLPGILRLTAGLTIIALAILAGSVVLDLMPLEQVAPYGRKILLLTLIVGLAATGIAGLVRWGRRS